MSHLEEGVLHALLDGEIPSSELPPFQAHLASCPECRARLEEERSLLEAAAGLVDALELPAIPAGAPPRSSTPARRRTWPGRLAWAASLIVAVGLGYLARGVGMQQEDAQLGSAFRTPPEVAAAPAPSPSDSGLGNRKDSTLDLAGSSATQNARAPLRVPAPASRPGVFGKAAVRGGLARERAAADSRTELPKPRTELAAEARPEASGAVAAAAPPVTQSADQPRRFDALRATSALTNLAEKTLPPAEAISLPDALRRLNGSLRLIDGLIALRLESQGPFVRVVYPTVQGELLLSQQLIDGRVVWTLLAPPGFPTDSLARLRARVRE